MKCCSLSYCVLSLCVANESRGVDGGRMEDTSSLRRPTLDLQNRNLSVMTNSIATICQRYMPTKAAHGLVLHLFDQLRSLVALTQPE